MRQQKFDTAGTALFTRNQIFDPFDRVSSQSEKVGAAQSISTRHTFVGLADQVAIEEERDTGGAWKVSKSYAYGANGENLSLVDSPVNGSTSEKSFYGINPHGDVETLTDATTGQTTSTYRYTAYGQPDTKGTTGDDAITGDAGQNADIVNPYRFNSKRFNGATGTYDMGFREYNPSLNRFLTRDMYAGALKDLGLGTDPWNANRYVFGGGNPIGRIELDGHLSAPGSEGGGGFVSANLELCGSDCYLDFSNGVDPVDPSPGDSFNDAVDNALLGAVQGVIETGEQASPVNGIRQATGTADSQLYHNLVQNLGADTNSTAYQASRLLAPLLIPTGAAGTGVRLTDRAAASLTEKAAAKLADDVANGGDDLVRVGRWMGESEHAAMLSTGMVQGGAGGTTYVARPADVLSYMKEAKSGTRYVEFDVPRSSVSPAGKVGWAQIAGPNSLLGRLAARRGEPLPQLPQAFNLEWIASKR